MLRAATKLSKKKYSRVKSFHRKLMTWDEAHAQGLLNAKAREFMDRDGNTPLHYFVRNFQNNQQLKEMILSYGEDDISVMSRTVNNFGALPYDVFKHDNHNLYPEEKKEARLILEKLMTKHNLTGISTLINIDEILKRNYDLENIQLKNNLIFGCEILNETRQIIKISFTHPQASNYPQQFQKMLWCFISVMRVTYPAEDSAKFFGRKYVNTIAKIIERTQVGNCFEFGILSLSKATDKNKFAYGIMLEIVEGDHIVPVINTYQTISSRVKLHSGVVVDGINRDVFPIDEIPFRLANFEMRSGVNRKMLRILTSLNLNYHTLKNNFSVNGNIFIPDFKNKNFFFIDEIANSPVFFKKNQIEKNAKAKVDEKLLVQKKPYL